MAAAKGAARSAGWFDLCASEHGRAVDFIYARVSSPCVGEQLGSTAMGQPGSYVPRGTSVFEIACYGSVVAGKAVLDAEVGVDVVSGVRIGVGAGISPAVGMHSGL